MTLRLAAALLLAGAVARADADPTYAALRAARPSGPGLAVENLLIERDVFRFRFERGTFQLLPDVEGRATGAVFVGRGTWELHPASEGERRQLAIRTRQKGLEVFTDRFDALVLLFTDGTEAQIRAAATETAAPSGAGAAWDDFRRTQRKDLRTNLQIRVLSDLLSRADPSAGVFLAAVDGAKLPEAMVLVDPAGLDWFAPDAMPGAENSGLWVIPENDSGFWYLARRTADAGKPEAPPRADADHYAIESTISDNTRLQGTTTIRFRAAAPGLRVLPILLFPKLRIQEAAFASSEGDSWTPIAFIQENEDEDADAAVILPADPAPAEARRVRISYGGKDVLRNMGDGSYAVGARQSWYPNLGTFRDTARFDISYSVPKGNQVVSVGRKVTEVAQGDRLVSLWTAERPIRVAGFNYGRFRRLDTDDADSGMRIEVFTNPGTPDLIREINFALQERTDPGLRGLQLDMKTFAEGAMADGINSARMYTAYFGPLAEKSVAITQQTEWFFGQSWPSLVFLPYLAVLDATQRHELGLGGTTDFVDLVGPHEIAHQWWGHSVGWESYRDLWLSEGFSEFSSSLVLQRTLGPKRFRDFWERSRRAILDKPPGSFVANTDAGPITQGSRLATRQTPAAYQTLVYSKGAYVLHMLRMLMWDPRGTTPDARFIAMMTDFARTYAGKNPSTRDFQAVVEKHMTPVMDLAKDRKMDWFFRQWVDGTDIPRYTVEVDVRKGEGDQFVLSGSVTQASVRDDFLGFLPLYLEYDKGEVQRLAVVTLTGNQTIPVEGSVRLPKKPKRVIANALHDVLVRD